MGVTIPSQAHPPLPDLERSAIPGITWHWFLRHLIAALPDELDCVQLEQVGADFAGYCALLRLRSVAGEDETRWRITWVEGAHGSHLAVGQVDEGGECLDHTPTWTWHPTFEAALVSVAATLREAAIGPIPFEDEAEDDPAEALEFVLKEARYCAGRRYAENVGDVDSWQGPVPAIDVTVTAEELGRPLVEAEVAAFEAEFRRAFAERCRR